jgi:hypothetical protein
MILRGLIYFLFESSLIEKGGDDSKNLPDHFLHSQTGPTKVTRREL